MTMSGRISTADAWNQIHRELGSIQSQLKTINQKLDEQAGMPERMATVEARQNTIMWAGGLLLGLVPMSIQILFGKA